MAEIDAKQLKEFDERLKSMYGTLGELEGTIKSVGTAITNTFGSATQNMVKEVQQAFRSIQLSDMLGVDIAKRDIKELGKEIATIEGNIKSKTSNGTASYSEKKNKWVYTKGNVKLTEEGEVESIEKLNRLYEKLKYSMMSREELLLRIQQTSGKMYSDEQRDLKKLQQEYYNYEQKVAIAKQNISAYTKGGSDSKQTKEQIAFWQKQADDYTSLMNSADDKINKYRENGVRLSLEEEAKMRLAQQEKLNQIENNKLGYASKEWKKETSQRTKRNADLDKRADEYRKSIEALTKAELELAQAEENLRQKQSGKANGQPYAENTIKGAEKSVAVARQNIIEAEEATKRFGASLASLKGGAQRLNEIRAAFGLIAESGQEAQKIPTVFDRVIAEINSRSERSKSQLAKSIIDAKSVRDEAKAAALGAAKELSYIWKGASVHGLDALKLRSTFSLTDFGVQGIANQIKLSDQYKANLDALKPEAREKLTEALNRYKEALQQVISLEEQKRRFDENTDKYSAQERAINGVTKRYQENEQAIQKLKDRWEELNVKKQAGLVNEKDFKQNTQKILDEYDRLINKRKEFEIGDLGEMSSERQKARIEEEQRITQIQRDNNRARVQDELNADKKIAAERARRARGLASTDPNMNAAVNKQIQYQRQLNALRKEYNALNTKQNRTKEDNVILEQTKQKIKDIIILSRQLNNEQKGSHNLAKQITDYDRIKQKIREVNAATKEHEESLDRLIPTLQRLGSAFGVAFSVRGLVQFGKKLIETRGEFELQQVALRSILQNKQVADEIWDKTMQAALQSPFTAMQLTRYTKQLAAYRIETEKLFDTTKRLGDISAGLGVEMDRLILAYGQVKAANYLRASEIRQFTEAGVNILGELSQYFTETRGQMVSTAQVMDMVQKRMVRFEDVEEIFKRMTDAGGIFYNMQYVQSQTVKGQINKLHDAYDQMLNNIGSANDGVLKNMVSLLLRIVQNWREWKTVLDSIMWPLLIASVVKFSRALLTSGASAKIASKELTGLSLAGAKTRVSLGKLATELKAFKFLFFTGVWGAGILTALTTLSFAAWNHAKAVREENKALDELSRRNYDSMANIDNATAAIEKNNKIIKEGKENTDEYKDAQSENRSLVNKLKSDYPELTDAISINAKGYVELNNQLDNYNAKMRLQIRLQQLSKGTFFDQSFGKDAKQFGEQAQKQADAVQKNLSEIDIAIQQNKAKLAEAQNETERQQFLGIINGLELVKYSVNEAVKQGNDAVEAFNKAYDRYFEKVKKAKKVYGGGRTYEIYESPTPTVKRIPGNTESGEMLREVKAQTKEYTHYIVELFKNTEGFVYKKAGDELLTDASFVKKYKTEIQNSLYTVGKDGKVIIGELGYELGEAFLNSAQQASTDAGRKNLLQMLIGDWEQSTGLILKYGVRPSKTESLPSLDETDKTKENASKFISLIKEMRSEYDKLSKSAYGYAKSEQSVRDSFHNSWESILKETGVKEGFDFTTNTGEIAAMERVRDYVKGNGKFNKDVWTEVQKEIDKLKADMELNVQVRIREDFARDMEDALGDYELTLDLQKLNLPTDLMEDMFNIESVDMTTLRQKVTDFYNELKAAGDVDREDMSKIEQYIKKMDDMERKAQRDRIKEYAKYLEYELSERAKISMDYAKKIADVQTERSIPADKREKIVAGLTKEMNEKLAKQDWEDFKGSEVYVQMMEDLEKHGTVALSSMRKELELIRKDAKNLSPRALKEVVSAIEKIREIELNRMDPFAGLKNSIADVNESLAKAGVSSKGELYAEAEENERNLVLTQRRKQEIDRIVAAQDRAVEIQKELNKLMKYQEISEVAYNTDIPIDKEVDAYKELLKEYEDEFDKLSDEDKALVKERLALSKELGRLITESSQKNTTENRKQEISSRTQEIENRVKEIDTLLDGKKIGENMAKGIIDAIKMVIKLKGELAGISEEDISNADAKEEQSELSDREKQLQELQKKYNKAVQDIDNYNKQVQRLISFFGEWTGKVQSLWSDLSNLAGAYSGEFSKFMGNWGKAFDVSLQQIGNLTRAFGEFKNAIAEYQKSATKKTVEKSIDELDNTAEDENTVKENENTSAVNRNTSARVLNTTEVDANTESIKANTRAKIENANADKKNDGGDVIDIAQDVVNSTNEVSNGVADAGIEGNTVAINANTAAKVENATAGGVAATANAAVGETAAAATPAVATFGATLTAVMGWVGLIAAALSALMTIITAVSSAHDDSIEDDIEDEQKKIDELQAAYGRLEKQIEKTWSSMSYMDVYEKQIENIKRQIAAIERQRELERSKKNSDSSKIAGYNNEINEAYDKLEELKQKQIEVFGGIGEVNYRSAAEGFVEAWKEAFLETGDGLQGLKDHFDEFLEDWFVKQATMRVAGKMLEHVFNQIDSAVGKYSEGGSAAMLSEIQKAMELAASIFPDMSDAFQELAGMFDISGEGGLSGLAAGIQGMTEEQANILEAYWNSVRMYTANIDINVERIANILGAGGDNANPMLGKLDSIINNTAYIKRIYDMLEPMITNNGSGKGFRTYNL